MGKVVSSIGLGRLATTLGTGAYNWSTNGFESLRYLGENPYSGWAIQNGINSIKTNPIQTPQTQIPITKPSDLIRNIHAN